MLAQCRECSPPCIIGGWPLSGSRPVEGMAGPGVGDDLDFRTMPPCGFGHRAQRIDPHRRHRVRLTHQRERRHRPAADDIRLVGQSRCRIVSDSTATMSDIELASPITVPPPNE